MNILRSILGGAMACLAIVGCSSTEPAGEVSASIPEKPKWEIIGGYTDETYREKLRRNEDAFFVRNARVSGVTEIDSGLQYRIVREGTGRKVRDADKVRIHYIVSELHGHRLEDSRPVSGREAIELHVANLNRGWQEVVPLMREGAIWRLFIPRDLVEGSVRTKHRIPRQALIYDVEIVEVMLSVADWYSPEGKEIRSSLEEPEAGPAAAPERNDASGPEQGPEVSLAEEEESA